VAEVGGTEDMAGAGAVEYAAGVGDVGETGGGSSHFFSTAARRSTFSSPKAFS
jgi:hypothetical protein